MTDWREKSETDQLPLPHTALLGLNPKSGYVPWPGLELATFWWDVPTNWATRPGRPPCLLSVSWMPEVGKNCVNPVSPYSTAVGEIPVEPQPRYAKLIMELLITKCLKGYLKETNIEGKKLSFYHKFKFSLLQSHANTIWNQYFSYKYVVFLTHKFKYHCYVI